MEDIGQHKPKHNGHNKQASDSLNSTFQNSMIVNSASSSIINNSNNIPLHSHYLYRKSPPMHNKESGVCSVNNSGLRLLNPVAKMPRKFRTQESSNLGKVENKLAFGSSEIRKIDIFQGKQQDVAQDTRTSMSQIMYRACLKNSQKQNIKNNERHKSEQVSFTTQNSTNNSNINTRLGFGISSLMQRISVGAFQKRNPGPGSYQICVDFNKKASPLPKKTYKHEDKTNPYAIEINKVVNQIGPGSYNLPTFSSQREQYMTKQKWKQRFTEKKQKMKDLMQKLNKNRLKTTPTLQQQSKQIHKSPIKIPNFTNCEKQNAKHTKLLRNELKQKTQNYLPKVEQKYSLSQDLFNDEYRGSPSKFKFSNCFIDKNDHAFQAHYYKAPEKEGEYIFIKGKYR